jgi:hypothetical protein
MRPNISTALSGGFGGMAPSVMQVAAVLAVGNSPTGSLPGRLCGFLAYGFLGAGVALVHKERKLAKAFFLGVGLPALLQAGANGAFRGNEQAPPPPVKAESQGAGFSFFATPAYAQEPHGTSAPLAQPTQPVPRPPNWPAGPRESNSNQASPLDRKLAVKVGELPGKDARLVFSSTDGKLQSSVNLFELGGSPVIVPDFATHFSVRVPSKGLRSPTYKLGQPKSSQTFSLEATDSFLGGFLQTLGVQSAQPVDLKLKELNVSGKT